MQESLRLVSPPAHSQRKKGPNVGKQTREKSFFVEEGANFEPPKGSRHASSLKAADFAILSSKPSVRRGAIIRAFKQGTPIGFVGEMPEEAFIGAVHGVSPATVRRNNGGRGLGRPDDFDFTYGLEYSGDDRSALVIAYPRGGILDTHNYRAGAPSNDYLVEKVDQTIRQQEIKAAADSGCGDWICLGTTHSSDRIAPFGEYDKWVTGRKADGSDPSYDYVSFQTEQNITPGDVFDNNNWYNDYTMRKMQFPLGDELRKHGPNSTSGSTSTTVGIGLSAGPSGGSASLDWSWTYSISDVVVKNDSIGTEEKFEVTHDIARNTNPAKHTYKTYPGCQLQVQQGQSEASYIFDDEYQWVTAQQGQIHTHHVNGDGSWVL